MTDAASSTHDRLAQIHEQLLGAVAELRSGEDWAQMLAVQARFHRYSWGNCLLIRAACPEATHVAGYRTWQGLGRQVRRGERGIAILAPVVVGEQESDAESEGHERRRAVRGFRVSFVFDVSQTEGEELVEVKPAVLEGDAPAQLYERLATQVLGAGYRLDRADCSPANGQTDFLARTVTVRPDLEGAQAAKTLCHELAHVLLHAELAGSALDGGACRGRAEVEAESVAYVVCATAGMDSGAYSFPYVARWAADLSVVADTATRVTACARAVSKATGLWPDEPELDPRDRTHSISSARPRSKPAPRRHDAARAQGRRGR